MTDSPLQLALRELRIDFTSPKGVIALLGVGLIFGVSGPFETFTQLTLLPRLLYWVGIVVASYATGSFINHFLQFRFHDRLGPFPLRVLLLGSATACGVFCVIVLINTLAFGFIYSSWQGLALTFAMVFAISIIVEAVLLMFSPLIDDDANKQPPLLDRLPLDKRGALISLSAEDHYVTVTTARGTEMLLMRLKDAMRETAPTTGLQVHRSHWVAQAAITSARRDGDRAVLTLSNGQEVPASRSFVPALREAGLFAKTANG